MHRCTHSAAGGTIQRLKPGLAMVRLRSRIAKALIERQASLALRRPAGGGKPRPSALSPALSRPRGALFAGFRRRLTFRLRHSNANGNPSFCAVVGLTHYLLRRSEER